MQSLMLRVVESRECALHRCSLQIIFIGTDDLVRRRRHCDRCHDVCESVCVWVCVRVCKHDETKTPDRIDSNLGTVIFLDTVSKCSGFGFKRSRIRAQSQNYFELLPPADT